MGPRWPQDGSKMARDGSINLFGTIWSEFGTEKGKTLEQHRKQMLRIGKNI